MAWVYILLCADGTYYVGSTTNLELRVWQHGYSDTEGAAYTRKRRPVELLWAADFSRVDDAFAFEKRVQGWSRRKREALIRGDFAALPGLSSRSWAALRAIRDAEADRPAVEEAGHGLGPAIEEAGHGRLETTDGDARHH